MTYTPASALPEMTSRAAAVVPPIVLPDAPLRRSDADAERWRRAAVPAPSVPMKSPSTRLSSVPGPAMYTPKPALPEMTSRAAVDVPPTVLPEAPSADAHPAVAVAQGVVAGGVGADVVALDDVVRRCPTSAMTTPSCRCPR